MGNCLCRRNTHIVLEEELVVIPIDPDPKVYYEFTSKKSIPSLPKFLHITNPPHDV